MPVFDLDTKAFPMLTPQQTSPFGGVLADAIAKRLALAQAQKEEKIVPYAGLAQEADIRSKNAYASAVAPQFTAKLMEHPEILANIKNPQQLLEKLIAFSQTGNNAGGRNVEQELAAIRGRQGQPRLGKIGQSVMDMFSGNNEVPESYTAPVQSNMPVSQPAQYDQNPATNGYSVSTPQQTESEGMQTVTAGSSTGRSPENIAFGGRAGEYKRQVKKGEVAGEQEGKQQSQYGEAAEGALSQKRAIDHLREVFQNPILEKITDVPFANQKALKWYKNTGTKEEKKAIGDMETAMNTFISSSLKLFGSRATNTDLAFLQTMKPNDSDTMDVRKGKLIGLETFNDAKLKQIEIADKMMSQGMSKAQAEFVADKAIDMKVIAERADKDIYPSPVKVMTPDGVRTFSARGAAKLLADHPDYHRIVE